MAETYSTSGRVWTQSYLICCQCYLAKVNYSRVLQEIQLFVQTETQPSDLYRTFQDFGETISLRFIDIEKRLTSVLDNVEVCEQAGENLYLYSNHFIPIF